jgi:hypothetical protein
MEDLDLHRQEEGTTGMHVSSLGKFTFQLEVFSTGHVGIASFLKQIIVSFQIH